MAIQIQLIVRDVGPKDILFVEREVPGATVVDFTEGETRSAFGYLPDPNSALVLVAGVGAAASALLYFSKTRSDTRVKVRTVTDPGGTLEQEIDISLSQSETPQALLEKIDKVVASLAAAGTGGAKPAG